MPRRRIVVGWLATLGVALFWVGRGQGTNGPIWTLDNPGPEAFERLGWSVTAGSAQSPARVIIGAPGYLAGGVPVGALFLRHVDTGQEYSTIVNPEPGAGDEFGHAVVWHYPHYILVGAPGDDAAGTDSGAVYLLDEQSAHLGGVLMVLRGAAAGDRFGSALAFVNAGGVNYFVVGAPGADMPGAVDAGKVYVFNGYDGTLLKTCVNPAPVAGDGFGTSLVALGGDYVIGAPLADRDAVDSGAAYLVSGTTAGSCPVLTTFVKPAPVHAGDQFGQALAVVEGNVVIGAPFGQGGPTGPGAAYLFDTAGAVLATLTRPGPPARDGFGWAVATAGSNLLIGAPFETTTASESGAAYLYDGPTGGLLESIPNPRPGLNRRFGRALAYTHGDVLIGSPGYADAATAQGAAYLIGITCGDGVLDPGETCDDGNMRDGDCCSSACQTEPPGPCDDENLCTVGDTCQGGACVGSCAAGTQCLGPCGENYVCQVAGGQCVCGAPPPPTTTTTTTTSTTNTTFSTTTTTSPGPNAMPVADAGRNQVSAVGQPVVLDGRASFDSDGAQLAFGWTLAKRPQGSTAALAGSSSATPSLTPDVAGLYRVQLVVDDGQLPSEPSFVTVTAMQQPPAIALAITTPAAGADIHADRVTVRGTVAGPPNVGVSVNGVTAVVSGGAFAAAEVPLVAGQNILAAVGAVPAGDVVTTSVLVNSDGAAPAVTLRAIPNAGLAPLTVTFGFSVGTADPVQVLSIDFDGDGTSDFTTSDSTATLENTYTVPGLYMARVTVTTQNGSVEANVPVAVQDEAVIVPLLQDAWTSMVSALASGDVDGALASFDGFGRGVFEGVFADLSPSLPSILATVSGLEVMQVGKDVAETWVLRDSAGVQNLFFVYFLRGPDGVWRIHSM
jgi:cysteine-rich repeat protein